MDEIGGMRLCRGCAWTRSEECDAVLGVCQRIADILSPFTRGDTCCINRATDKPRRKLPISSTAVLPKVANLRFQPTSIPTRLFGPPTTCLLALGLPSWLRGGGLPRRPLLLGGRRLGAQDELDLVFVELVVEVLLVEVLNRLLLVEVLEEVGMDDGGRPLYL